MIVRTNFLQTLAGDEAGDTWRSIISIVTGMKSIISFSKERTSSNDDDMKILLGAHSAIFL